MDKYYIFEFSKNKELSGDEAIIVLPDIYCQTDYSKDTVERFAKAFKKPTFMLDYFAMSSGKANILNEEDREEAHGLMQNFDAEAFIPFFQKALSEIRVSYPNVKEFIVVGFCFGGRLAYIIGGEKEVVKVFSFYGSGALTPNYIDSNTPVDYLVSKKKRDHLEVNSFFGINDKSIPEEDRRGIKERFSNTNINYSSYEYDAGHAYFQEGRKNFDAQASLASWEVLKQRI